MVSPAISPLTVSGYLPTISDSAASAATNMHAIIILVLVWCKFIEFLIKINCLCLEIFFTHNI